VDRPNAENLEDPMEKAYPAGASTGAERELVQRWRGRKRQAKIGALALFVLGAALTRQTTSGVCGCYWRTRAP
jgi:hypothetical protein